MSPTSLERAAAEYNHATGQMTELQRDEYNQATAAIARSRTQETKLMLDTQEKFTKRYQWDRMSHKLLSKTPTQNTLSGSAHNDLTKYDSKTVFRNAIVSRNKSHMPQPYSAMLGNKSPSLPNIPRQRSAQNQQL